MKNIFIRTLCLTLTALVLLTCLPACAQTLYTEGQGELSIVASSFIPFDFARNVTAEKAKITVLQTDGGDLHGYTPTTASLEALSNADIFICIGGISDDAWIDDAIKASGNKNLTVIKLTELVEGELASTEGHSHNELCKQTHTHGGDGDHGHEHTADDGHGHTADEHVWTSLRNAAKAVKKISAACAERDSANSASYEENAAKYIEKLNNLDSQYAAAVAESQSKALIFADRFPFIYLIKDYSLCYHAAFSGCSSETDADFETAVRLTEAARHSGSKYVLVTEDSDKKLAQSIADATGCEILKLYSMQSVSRSEIEAGADYLNTMQLNLETLKAALL